MYILSNKQFKELTDKISTLQKVTSQLEEKMEALEGAFGIEREDNLTFALPRWYTAPYKLKRWEEFLKTLGYEYQQETTKEGWVKTKK